MSNREVKCIIVEDETPAIRLLEKYILATPNLSLAGIATHAAMAYELIHKNEIDLIFLDIELPRINGITFINSLKNPPKVIFTTAHRNYAVEGFELDAVDFLLKPFSLERFDKAIKKFFNTSESKGNSLNSNFIYLKTEWQTIKIPLSSIILIESQKDYCKVKTEDKMITIKQSLTSLSNILPKSEFLRVQKSFIISTLHVESFTRTSIKIGGQYVPIGRQYKTEVLSLLLNKK